MQLFFFFLESFEEFLCVCVEEIFFVNNMNLRYIKIGRMVCDDVEDIGDKFVSGKCI